MRRKPKLNLTKKFEGRQFEHKGTAPERGAFSLFRNLFLETDVLSGGVAADTEGLQNHADNTFGREHDKHTNDAVDNLALTLLSFTLSGFRGDELENPPEKYQKRDGKDQYDNRVENILVNLA